ncbi:MAG: hypothetical protein AAF488_08605 [Planctomycetota bacterium]
MTFLPLRAASCLSIVILALGVPTAVSGTSPEARITSSVDSQASSSPGIRTSSARLGATTVELIHTVDPDASVPDVDLSAAGSVELSGSALFTCAVPLQSGESVLPPGNYEVGLEVDAEESVTMTFRSTSARSIWRWSVEIGEFDRPVFGTHFNVVATSFTRQKEEPVHRGRIQIRQRSWILEAPFQVVLTETKVVEGWELVAPRITSEGAVPSPGQWTYLGNLKDRSKGRVRRVFVSQTPGAEPEVHFVDRHRDSLGRVRAEIEAELETLGPKQLSERAPLQRRKQSLSDQIAKLEARDSADGGRLRRLQESPRSTRSQAMLVEESGETRLLITGPFGRGVVPISTSHRSAHGG